ncbi:MAG: 23S rRNA (guanosine(2251)-2'-O)-methyltransferase RlmB [Clostridia bacterium]|nr:23S rRNA (guanosine(2251)-2'-O)-methyltransferase RlmB [Clostridia bacterium]
MKKNYDLPAGSAEKGKRSDRAPKKFSSGKPSYEGRPPIRREESGPAAGIIVGRNAVRELLKSDRAIDKILVRRGDREGSIVVLVAEAIKKGIPVIETDAAKLDSLSGSENHQGIVAMAAEKEYVSVDDILAIAEERGEKPLIVIADCIEDPYNLGALIRCAECAGAHGIIVPKRHAVGLTPAVTKASAGAIEHMAIAKVSNIATTIEDLKKKGLWVFASEAGGTAYYETDFDTPAAIVFGSEGNGVGRLIKERSDFIVSIPMYGKVNSLNVSTAASVILCHAARMQREKK